MDQENNDLQGQIEGGYKEGETPPVTPEPAPSEPGQSPDAAPASPEPKEPQAPVISEELMASKINEAVANAKVEFMKEHQGANTPEPDFLQEAIDKLPDEQKALANDLKPVLEKISDQHKDGYISKTEAEEMQQKATEDAVNIQHLENWKTTMSKEWDGQNGKPQFVWVDLDKFMQEKSYTDPEDAFYLMNREAIVKYSASITKQPTPTIDPGGGKPQPGGEQKGMPENVNDAMELATQKATERLKSLGY